MTDTTTLAPTDAELMTLADDFDVGYTSGGRLLVGTNPDCDFTSQVLSFARAVLAKWGAPAPASGELVAEVMFDERKYIQYTIPLELLPVGAKFYTAQEARVPLDRIARDLLFDVKNRVNALVLLTSSERRESEIRIKQDIADFLAAPLAQEERVPLTLNQRADIHESLKYEGPDGREADWGDVIDAVEKHHGITAAQKEAP